MSPAAERVIPSIPLPRIVPLAVEWEQPDLAVLTAALAMELARQLLAVHLVKDGGTLSSR